MALQYVTVKETDLGGGIDAQSTENKIPQGYCEDIENADPKSTGQISKRTGYQGYAGYLPVRVKEVEYVGTDINFILDSSISLPLNRVSPIIVHGQTSEAAGDFASETSIYYSAFVAEVRETFDTINTTVTRTESDHGVSTPIMFTGLAQSTSPLALDNEQFLPETITITQADNQIDIDYFNNTGSDFTGFVFNTGKTAVTGEVYNHTATVGTGSVTETILGTTHSLDNTNLLIQTYRDTGTEYVKLNPDSVTVNPNTGDVNVTLENNTGSSIDILVIISIAPPSNVATGSVAAGQTETIVIDTSVTGGTSFAFISCYLEPSIGGTLEQVYPDSIIADESADTITVTFTNNKTSGANFEIYWEYANISSNKLTITATNSANFTDTAPQLTIYGLCHEEIYGTREAREGWVNHIDSYRAPGDTRLISGLGGNLFAARFASEGTIATDFLLPTLYPRLNSRVSADQVIGPAFYDTGETPGRTRGFLTADDGSDNFFTISAINYNSGTGYVDYTISAPNLVISGTLSTIISSATGLEDILTVQQAGYAVHNGAFTIKGVTNPATDTLVISVDNSEIISDDFDETDVGGEAGIFTDRLVLNADSPFLSDDLITSSLFDGTNNFTCVNSSGTTLLLNNIVDIEEVPGGLRLVGTRESEIIPLRTITNSASVDNFVRGDMVNLTNTNRELRVKSINQLSDVSVSITGDGVDTATVTVGSGDVSTVFVGKKLLISGTTSYNGTVTVTAVPTSTTFQFASTSSTTEAGTMVGKTIEVDEILEYSDSTNSSISVSTIARWLPIEAPTDSYDLTPSTRVNYFDSGDYDNQNIIRSTMVQDNLYMTNYDDEVMKFDGADMYRAGLFRWQPQLFMGVDRTSGAIVTDNNSATVTGVSSNTFTVAAGEEQLFTVGETILHSDDNETYTVTDTSTAGEVTVNKLVTGAGAGNISQTSLYSYYFRMNAVDANNNIIASAITGAEDFNIRLAGNSTVYFRLVGMPSWDVYDYDRLEVQVYRTTANSPAPFYRLTTLQMSFDNGDGYIDYTDTDSDEDLRNLDEVSTALAGGELGTTWGQPLRAKYCTTAGNRLVLGNLKDYPTLDIQLFKNEAILSQSIFTDINNRRWLLRKSNLDTGTATDMINRAAYQFTSSSSTVSGITGTADTSFSVNVTGHGLSAGDWTYLFHTTEADDNSLVYAGWWQVSSVTDVDNFVVLNKLAESGAAAAGTFPDGMATASTTTDVPVYLGTDANYVMLNGNKDAAGDDHTFLAMRRLANAINASMRQVDATVSGLETFVPWVTANAGNEFNTGQLLLKQPKETGETIEVVVPTLTGDFDVYVNNVQRAGDEEVSSLTRLFPSRIIISYPNYPEIFDAPTAVLETESDSVIDINSADGQEITAIIPFFGDAAFGSAQKSGIVVVFKTQSIYLVDLAAKAAGQNPVQRLETRGKGCTAPFSVAVTKDGIMFANDTGMYRLGRDLRVDYIGRKYERKWETTVNKDSLTIATGHHDANANSYKLSYPLTAENENSTVAVYNHTREYEGSGIGSWTTYTNHPATGWANLDADSFFSSTGGRVFALRKTGTETDYRDDDIAIPMTVITRAMDMGDSGIRKIYSSVTTHYRNIATTSGTTLSVGLDLTSQFQDTDAFRITKSDGTTNFSDLGYQKVITIQSSFDKKVGVYIQCKYENSTIDEPVEIAGMDVRVAAKSDQGVTQAAQTT